MHWLDIQQWLYNWWLDATAKKGWLVVFGLTAQAMFMGRFVVQWIASERAKRSVVPEAFWYFSLGGGLMIFTYGLLDRDLVVLAGQLPALAIYSRNLVLIHRERRETGRIESAAEARREVEAE